jgi:Holliday junction resolvase RusA-like endonuclease
MPDTNAQALSQIFFTIFGEPASKANSRRLVARAGRPMFIKSAKALDYADKFKLQAPASVPFECDVKVAMTIYYASRRPDLDESLILDLLQGVTYLNDRQVKEKHIRWALDKDLPRCEILVTPWSG